MRWTLTIMMTLAIGCGLHTPDGEILPIPVDKNDPTVEICNGIDDDGDGRIDNGMLTMGWNSMSTAPQARVGAGIAQQEHIYHPREYVTDGVDGQAPAMEASKDEEWVTSSPTTSTVTYDKDGNEMTFSWVGVDGKLNTYLYQYDIDGTSTGLNYFLCEADMSSCEYELEVRHVFDAEGRTVMNFYNHYAGPDRILVSRVTEDFTYREDSQVTSLTRSFDLDADGTAEKGSASYYTYGDDAKLVALEKDADLDGTIDEISHTIRDNTGQFVTISKDKGADGTVDEITTEIYDADGKLLSRSVDSDADGSMEEVYTVTYDSDGNREATSYTWMTDRVVDRQVDTTYDDRGSVLMWTRQVDLGDDGVLDMVYVKANTYNADGNQLTHLSYRDSDKDGALDILKNVVYTYNADGHLAGQVIDEDNNSDGKADVLSQTTYIYDCDGNLVTRVMKHENRGEGTKLSAITNYSFVCHGQ